MFSSNDAATKKQEIEKKQLQAAMAECQKIIDSMKSVQPPEAERLKQRLMDTIKRYPKLPIDFKQSAGKDARSFECFSNMRAVDVALNNAMRMAQTHNMIERGKQIGAARTFLHKAIGLGADKEFQVAAERKIENVMMTGGVEHKGPTGAKPTSIAPKNTHNAKA